MKHEYIESGRYPHPTIWIKGFTPLAQYPNLLGEGSYFALNIGQAIDLYKALTLGLREAGQGGILTAEIK